MHPVWDIVLAGGGLLDDIDGTFHVSSRSSTLRLISCIFGGSVSACLYFSSPMYCRCDITHWIIQSKCDTSHWRPPLVELMEVDSFCDI
jgi:hypothetical protein